MGSHAALVPKHGLFIDGHWVEPLKDKRIPIVNPTTEEPVGDIPAATSEDVDVAVKAAKDAFYRNKGQDWAKASGKHRATFLRAIAKRVAERKSELAKLESIDCGKPIDEAEWDIVRLETPWLTAIARSNQAFSYKTILEFKMQSTCILYYSLRPKRSSCWTKCSGLRLKMAFLKPASSCK